jgi:hypothetical protein
MQPASTAAPDTLVTSTEDLSYMIKDTPLGSSDQEIVPNDAALSPDSPTAASMARKRPDLKKKEPSSPKRPSNYEEL